VSGENFDDGAAIFINNQKQRTVNDEQLARCGFAFLASALCGCHYFNSNFTVEKE